MLHAPFALANSAAFAVSAALAGGIGTIGRRPSCGEQRVGRDEPEAQRLLLDADRVLVAVVHLAAAFDEGAVEAGALRDRGQAAEAHHRASPKVSMR
jgi:hypothetical protein